MNLKYSALKRPILAYNWYNENIISETHFRIELYAIKYLIFPSFSVIFIFCHLLFCQLRTIRKCVPLFETTKLLQWIWFRIKTKKRLIRLP